ncbi:hypothetical protein BJ912DRAFT_1042461 [Pholiota molesta]|nr:hypothetical protein BJ912DRAFT_1042461 [Pholiota molesta]
MASHVWTTIVRTAKVSDPGVRRCENGGPGMESSSCRGQGRWQNGLHSRYHPASGWTNNIFFGTGIKNRIFAANDIDNEACLCTLRAARTMAFRDVITPRATSNSWSKSRALRASFRPHLRTLVETSGAVNYAAMTGLLQPFQCANISFSFTYLCISCPIRARRSELSW